MTIKITGRHIEVSDSMKAHIEESVHKHITKYFNDSHTTKCLNDGIKDFGDGGIKVEVVLSKEADLFDCHISINDHRGVFINSVGKKQDAYDAINIAVRHLGNKLRKHKDIIDHTRAAKYLAEDNDGREEI